MPAGVDLPDFDDLTPEMQQQCLSPQCGAAKVELERLWLETQRLCWEVEVRRHAYNQAKLVAGILLAAALAATATAALVAAIPIVGTAMLIIAIALWAAAGLMAAVTAAQYLQLVNAQSRLTDARGKWIDQYKVVVTACGIYCPPDHDHPPC